MVLKRAVRAIFVVFPSPKFCLNARLPGDNLLSLLKKVSNMIPLEKLLVRILLVLAVIFFFVSMTYYSWMHAILPFLFIILLIGADALFSKESESKNQQQKTIFEKVIFGLLIVIILVCLAAVARLWKVGHFGRL